MPADSSAKNLEEVSIKFQKILTIPIASSTQDIQGLQDIAKQLKDAVEHTVGGMRSRNVVALLTTFLANVRTLDPDQKKVFLSFAKAIIPVIDSKIQVSLEENQEMRANLRKVKEEVETQTKKMGLSTGSSS